ncbi:MAG: hypothetical protein ACRDKS_04965 [Actinomycetota bacterium]
MSRGLVAVAVVALCALSACEGGAPLQTARAACVPARNLNLAESPDEGPCVLDGGIVDGEQVTLVGSWNRRPPEGSAGDGPCINIELATRAGASGGGWCDLPEARLIGEYVSDAPTASTVFAWGPTSAGRVAEVRIEIVGGDPIVVKPKPTPWREFDFWFAAFPAARRPSALVAFDADGKEISREDLSGRPA